jgi:hypothetical protein
MKQKKKGKITLSFTSPEKEKYFFYIYDVIVKQKKRKRSANHYSHTHTHTHTHTNTDIYMELQNIGIQIMNPREQVFFPPTLSGAAAPWRTDHELSSHQQVALGCRDVFDVFQQPNSTKIEYISNRYFGRVPAA